MSNACSEVQLALMSTQESVEMLAHSSGLDSTEVPPALLEVAKLCGRLPLCLTIAAQMICEAGDQWQEEVLPDLAASFMHGDGIQISVQDSIIVSSLNSISGSESQQVKAMFMSTAVFAGACRLSDSHYAC